jgi:hypothetical protein
VLFIALIVMVAMSLAAIALIGRSTTNILIGTWRSARGRSCPQTSRSSGGAALFADAAIGGVPAIADTTADLPAENYYAKWQNSDDARGIPLQLQTKSAWTLPKQLDATDNTNASVAPTTVRYVIERMCIDVGVAKAGICDMMPPKQNPGTTVHDDSVATLNPIPFYRVTVRVDGPQNTASFLQAMLR